MVDIKVRAQGLDAEAKARNVKQLAEPTGNLYLSLNIISRRANQISATLKQELHSKLEEFAVSVENLEEVHENKEQIEISKFYERLPNPALIATNEFLEGKLYYRKNDEEEEQTEE